MAAVVVIVVGVVTGGGEVRPRECGREVGKQSGLLLGSSDLRMCVKETRVSMRSVIGARLKGSGTRRWVLRMAVRQWFVVLLMSMAAWARRVNAPWGWLRGVSMGICLPRDGSPSSCLPSLVRLFRWGRDKGVRAYPGGVVNW